MDVVAETAPLLVVGVFELSLSGTLRLGFGDGNLAIDCLPYLPEYVDGGRDTDSRMLSKCGVPDLAYLPLYVLLGLVGVSASKISTS